MILIESLFIVQKYIHHEQTLRLSHNQIIILQQGGLHFQSEKYKFETNNFPAHQRFVGMED